MRSEGLVSSQSFGSSAVSLACITSMCSVQRFPGGHSLRLAFGPFFYHLILAVFAVRSSCFFLPCLWQRLAFVQSLFPRNLGRQSWPTILGHSSLRSAMVFARVFRLQPHGSKVQQQLGGSVFGRQSDCGIAFTCLAVKRPTSLVVQLSTSLAGQAVHKLIS